jgi:hypothetical protein
LQDATNSGAHPWVNQSAPNIFNLPRNQGGLKEIVEQIIKNSKSGTITDVWCATGPYAVAYYGKPTENWAIYVNMNNGDRVCIDASNNIRKYKTSPWESVYLWNGKCENY